LERLFITLVFPIWLCAQTPPPELLVLVNNKRITIQDNTLQLKASDQLTIFDTISLLSSTTYFYKLDNKEIHLKDTSIALYTNLKSATYTFQAYKVSDGEASLTHPFKIIVKRNNTWWYVPAFMLYLLVLSGSAVYAITVNKVRNASKIYTLRSEWTNRLHTEVGGDLDAAAGRVKQAQKELKKIYSRLQELWAKANLFVEAHLHAPVSTELLKALDIFEEIERKLRFVFDLIDPKKDSLQTVLNDLDQCAKNKFAMKDIQLDYQNSLLDHEILKIDLTRIEKLGLITKEVINNIYKHSEATHTSIHIKRENKGLWMQIMEDGKGFDLPAKLNEPDNHDGNGNGGRIGLKSLFSLAKDGLIDFDMWSEPGSGTRTTIFVPEL